MSNPSPPPSPPPSTSPPPDYPEIDPTNFDLILVGTSLPNSIIAAAAATTSKTVLHLDPSPFYGSLFATLAPPLLSSLPLTTPIDLPSAPPAAAIADVSGPRVLFSADSAIDLLLRSQVSQYLEFKAIDENLIFDSEKGCLITVPDSRTAIFKDKGLSLPHKTRLMQFFKLVEQHLTGVPDHRVSDEDLESPFFEFLSSKGLPKRIIGIILYAIALAYYDQENAETCHDLLKTRDGISRLALYHSSIGRFPNAPGAMLYPMYGQGELPQAFCRRAAVKGSIYVLRMPVSDILTDKDTGVYTGVRLASGQDIFSKKLVMDPNSVIPPNSEKTSNHSCSRETGKKVARAICITKTSLKSDSSNLLIVVPPRSLYSEQTTSVRALQISSNSAVCPAGMFVVHLSTLCNDANEGETLLTAAIGALFRQPVSGSVNNDPAENSSMNSDGPNVVQDEQRPVVEWSALYIQEITEGSVDTISTSPSPDGNLGYHDIINATETMFKQMYPGEEFFPVQADPDDNKDEDNKDEDNKDEDSEVVDPE